MNAITTARRAILVDSKEVTFTPYVIRKVGEVRKVTIDGTPLDVIYNERRNLTYFVLTIEGVATTGRIVAELKEGGTYETVKKAARVAPPAGKRAAKIAAPEEAPAKFDETNTVLKTILGAIEAPTKKPRKPKAD